jgi:uncharacterized repeat protein (TIGR03803 family)
VTGSGGRAGQGAVYRLDAQSGDCTILHSFFDGGDTSRAPYGGPTWVAPDWLYGTAAYGELGSSGVIYRLRTDGSDFSVVHAFEGGPDDGATPLGALQIDAAWIYGTTQNGGTHGGGTLYRTALDLSDHMLLHSFGGPGDGALPVGGPLLVGFTRLYGATWGGGAAGLGTVFSSSFDGSGYEVLHEFAGGTDGSRPRAPAHVTVAPGFSDFVFGATQAGGSGGVGTLYRLEADTGDLETVHAFDGAGPNGGVHPALTTDGGNLYGFTTSGGPSGHGEIFRLRFDGSGFENLHSFAGLDGRVPQSVRFEAGRLVGTTYQGGARDHGVIYALDLPEVFAGTFESGGFEGWSVIVP